MFEFVTISNGLAVVQHGASGHVYRFRPMQPGEWSRLMLDRVDVCQDADDRPEIFQSAALYFAEKVAAACFRVEPEWVATAPAPVRLLARLPARQHGSR